MSRVRTASPLTASRPAPGEPPGAAPAPSASRGEDSLLITAVKAGDTQAFSRLIEKYQHRVYGHCLRMTGHEAEAFDLAQEVFLKVYRHIGRYEHTYAFYTWIYRITDNCCIDYARKRKRETQRVSLSLAPGAEGGATGREQDIPDDSYVPDKRVLQQELRTVLDDAIGKLSAKLRRIIVLKEIEGLSYEEIAEVLQCSRGTVKSRLFRARERLKELLRPYLDG